MQSLVKFFAFTKKRTYSQSDGWVALGLGVLAFLLYASTAAPGLLDGDPGEFQFAAWNWGLAHPTGYPFYLIVGGVWQHGLALLGADPAWTLNLFSAALGAATVALLYAFMARLLPATPWRRAAALFSTLLFMLNPTFWSQSTIAEVYTLHALLIVLVLQAWHVADSHTPSRSFHLVILSIVLGLALSHHRTALFLLPGFGLWLFWQNHQWWRHPRTLGWLFLGLGLPQLLYFYIPLRSGPQSSPWLYPTMNGETLALYEQSWQGFVNFITGSVFAVSFLDLPGALARMPQMADLWLQHFGWPGLALMLFGLFTLFRQRRWPLLMVTLPFALILQIFNLFYGIGDIYVFYIPLYLVGSMWAGIGGWGIVNGGEQRAEMQSQSTQYALRITLYALLTLFTLVPLLRFYPQIDQSENDTARQMWTRILNAQPPQNAILVSNDRNEIVPLYYLQSVEGKAQAMTGLFPLLTPEARFADIGAVLETALAGEPPVYLIKPMPGLETRFESQSATAPLVEVIRPVSVPPDLRPLDLAMGPLTLLGYTWTRSEMTLYWQVESVLAANYTTTVQIFDENGGRLAQQDQRPGGDFYPTSLWKPGEILRELHTFNLDADQPVSVLVGMYQQEGAELMHLAPPITWTLP